jgi:hypothetical protein
MERAMETRVHRVPMNIDSPTLNKDEEAVRNDAARSRVGSQVKSSPKERNKMRRIFLALAAVAAVGIAMPTFAPSPADARTMVVIKKKHHRYHHNRGHHYGWYKHRRHHHHHGARVVIR